MGKEPHVKLRTRIREICEERNDVERLEVNEIVRLASHRYGKLVEQEKDRLLREAIGNMVRSLFHRESSSQLLLPMELAKIGLPDRIAVRPKGKKSGPADWVLSDCITFDELDEKVKNAAPRAKPRSEWAKLQACRDYLKPHMAVEHRFDPIGPVLTRLAHEEAEKAESDTTSA